MRYALCIGVLLKRLRRLIQQHLTVINSQNFFF